MYDLDQSTTLSTPGSHARSIDYRLRFSATSNVSKKNSFIRVSQEGLWKVQRTYNFEEGIVKEAPIAAELDGCERGSIFQTTVGVHESTQRLVTQIVYFF